MRSRWFGLVIAALAVAIAIWAYPSLPPTVATHWDLRGTPDGFSSRLMAVLIGPLLIIGITLLFNVLPKVDPRRENYARFVSTYWLFANAVIVFMLILHGLVIATGLGYSVRIDRMMPLFIGLLFVVIGNYLTRVEPNWFVGIRTPWTMSSDTVWRKTHRTGGWLMVLGGLALATGAFLPPSALLPLFIGLLFVVIGNYLTRVEPNWFVGIRTPWTMSSDTVWRKTHRTGGWLMVIGGLALATGAFLPPGALLPLLIGTVVVVAVIPIVQSYVLWKREQGARSREQV